LLTSEEDFHSVILDEIKNIKCYYTIKMQDSKEDSYHRKEKQLPSVIFSS
jgi:hypothetical protein